MNYLLVRHRVADFFRWKAIFHSYAKAQRQAGLRALHIWRNVDESNEVFVLLEVADLKKAKDFVTSPDVPNAQNTSGVLGQPDVYFLME